MNMLESYERTSVSPSSWASQVRRKRDCATDLVVSLDNGESTVLEHGSREQRRVSPESGGASSCCFCIHHSHGLTGDTTTREATIDTPIHLGSTRRHLVSSHR